LQFFIALTEAVASTLLFVASEGRVPEFLIFTVLLAFTKFPFNKGSHI
jgi:hypothetical protein